MTKPTGVSPLGAWQLLTFFMPLLSLVEGDAFVQSARLAERVAARLGSPRAQLVSQSWHAIAEYRTQSVVPHRELPGLRAQAVQAGIGLRVLPQLFTAMTSRNPEDFYAAERLARRAGNTSGPCALAIEAPRDHWLEAARACTPRNRSRRRAGAGFVRNTRRRSCRTRLRRRQAKHSLGCRSSSH